MRLDLQAFITQMLKQKPLEPHVIHTTGLTALPSDPSESVTEVSLPLPSCGSPVGSGVVSITHKRSYSSTTEFFVSFKLQRLYQYSKDGNTPLFLRLQISGSHAAALMTLSKTIHEALSQSLPCLEPT
jgi:hypothetical protein